MRHARVKTEGTGCYHVVSRIVDRAFKLDDGEKEIFRRMMRKAEAFSGVRVLTYAVMSNHFHLLVEVPEWGEVGGAELLRRMTALYGTAYVAARTKQWDEWRKNNKTGGQVFRKNLVAGAGRRGVEWGAYKRGGGS
jgi:REP element-mobilizing transposase RayT